MIKTSLDLSKGFAVTQVNDLAKWHDSLFKGMAENLDAHLPSEKEAAISLLYDFGLHEGQTFKPVKSAQNAAPGYSDIPCL
jgi:hypothetical protein